MPLQILLNLLIAFIWMFLHDTWSSLTFFLGYLLGMAIIFSLRRWFPGGFYLRRVVAIGKLLFLFIYELILSTIVVARQITRPIINVTPGIFKVDTRLETDFEITLLSCLITLTPGSVVIEVEKKEKVSTLYIHTMDIPESEELVLQAKNSFEHAIMGVTR